MSASPLYHCRHTSMCWFFSRQLGCWLLAQAELAGLILHVVMLHCPSRGCSLQAVQDSNAAGIVQFLLQIVLMSCTPAPAAFKYHQTQSRQQMLMYQVAISFRRSFWSMGMCLIDSLAAGQVSGAAPADSRDGQPPSRRSCSSSHEGGCTLRHQAACRVRLQLADAEWDGLCGTAEHIPCVRL